MAWLLDTNAWIQILKRPGGSLEQAVISHPPIEILLCSVVKAELWHGAQKYERRDRRLAVLAKLFGAFVSLPFDDDAAWHYAGIRHQLEAEGRVIGPNDLKIAAICRASDLTLVTSNTTEFSHVPGLRIEDWTNHGPQASVSAG
jgi:tRNA(fMet)-specific endonuclease VapC